MSKNDKHDGRNSPVSELPGALKKIVEDSVSNVFHRPKDNTKKTSKREVPKFGEKPKNKTKKGGRKRRKTRRKRRKSRRKRRKSRRKRRKSRRKKRR